MTSVLCLSPDGTIPIMFVNIPGAIHDSQVADYGETYDKLELVYLRDGGKCSVDSAFGNVSRDFLIKSSQVLMHIEDHWEQRIAHDVSSMQQSAEWGIRVFQSSMPRVKDWMKFKTRGEGKVPLTMMILSYNLHSLAVGIRVATLLHSIAMQTLNLFPMGACRNSIFNFFNLFSKRRPSQVFSLGDARMLNGQTFSFFSLFRQNLTALAGHRRQNFWGPPN